MKRTRLNRYSRKKLAELNGEYETRIALCYRCKGKPNITVRYIKMNGGERLQLKTVTCIGGYCEICGKPAYPNQPLHPHEIVFRSKGGKLSLENSVMCHDYPCHTEAQNNEPKWSKT